MCHDLQHFVKDKVDTLESGRLQPRDLLPHKQFEGRLGHKECRTRTLQQRETQCYSKGEMEEIARHNEEKVDV